MANGQPKPAFYVAVFIVILGLVGLALYRYGAHRRRATRPGRSPATS